MSERRDVAIVGAGIAGASLAAALAPHGRVLVLEAEARPGYHATGRSAAFWSESYGGPLVRPLTSASAVALAPFLHARGAIHLADADGEAALDALAAEFPDIGLRWLDRATLDQAIPGLRPGWDRGLAEPSCADIDVAALHASCLKGIEVVTDARLLGAARHGGRWRLETAAGPFEADILVNAAGAWADAVAALAGEGALGIQPCRRTLAQLRVAPPAPAALPLVIDALGRFYFKPEPGGRIWLSPHDETACTAHDVAAEELDVALAIDRLEQAVDWRVAAVERKWAGLRSFARDRLPVYGFGEIPGFFWCAGQGGFGIQTAPAAARLAADLLLGRTSGAIDPRPYAPARLRN
jgi:D-arginine dehydrogenase